MGFLPGSDSIVNARLMVDGRLAAAAGGPPAHFNPDADKIKPDAEERLSRSQGRFAACRLLVYKSVPPVRIRFAPPASQGFLRSLRKNRKYSAISITRICLAGESHQPSSLCKYFTI
jgi:hypothetical protein